MTAVCPAPCAVTFNCERGLRCKYGAYHQRVTNEEMEADKLKQVNAARGSVADSRAFGPVVRPSGSHWYAFHSLLG